MRAVTRREHALQARAVPAQGITAHRQRDRSRASAGNHPGRNYQATSSPLLKHQQHQKANENADALLIQKGEWSPPPILIMHNEHEYAFV